jgi:hypothetical protein
MRLLAAVLLAITLTACGDTGEDSPDTGAPAATVPADDNSSAGGDCDEAWQAAADVSDTEDTHEDLHPAFTACTSFDEWAAASERHPSVLDGSDPLVYAQIQCEYVTELSDSPVCTSLP